MSPLETAKQLLVAESELNRDQMLGDVLALKERMRGVADRARSCRAMASSIAGLAVGLAALTDRYGKRTGAKPSLLSSLLNGAGMVSSFWLAFQARSRDPEANNDTQERQSHVTKH